MYLHSCHIENFGKLHDFTLDFTENLMVLERQNEWGKSTLAAFIRVMFYGFANENKRGNALERERVYYKPWQGGVYGGELEFEIGGKRYRVNRTFGVKETEDTFALYDGATGVLSDDFSEKIGEELFRINGESFRRTVFIAQNDCVTATTDSINAKLGNLAETMDDLGRYEQAQSKIKDEMNALSPTRKTGSIRRQKEEIAGIRSELRKRETVQAAAEELRQKLASVRGERDRMLGRRTALQEEWNRASARQAALAKRAHYESLLRQRDERRTAADEALTACGGQPGEHDERTIDRYLEQWKICGDKEADLNARQAVLDERKAELEEARGGRHDSPLFAVLSVLLVIGGITLFVAGTTPLGAGLTGAGIVWLIVLGLRGYAAQKQREAAEAQQAEDIAALEQEIQDDEDAIRQKEAEIREYLELGGCTADEALDVQAALYELKNKRQLYRALETQLRSCEQAVIKFEQENNITKFREPEQETPRSPEEIRAELRQCENALEQNRLTEDAYRKQLDGAQAELEQLEEQAETLETLERERGEAQRHYKDLELTAQYLTRAKELFTAQFLEPITRAYRTYYELLTGCSGEEYRMDANLCVTRREAGEQRDLRTLSTGSRDLTGICLRMALIDAMYPDEKPFVILDDSFVNLDDVRLTCAKRFLREVSRKYQILYFTCQKNRALD